MSQVQAQPQQITVTPSELENKRHGSDKITKILNLVNEQFLDGEALKSQLK